jgi:hypothetical protein
MDDDILRKAAGAALLDNDRIARTAAGLPDPFTNNLRRVAEGLGTDSYAMALATAGVSSASLAVIRDAFAGSDVARMTGVLRDAALLPATDMLRIAGVDPALTAHASWQSTIDPSLFRLPQIEELKRLTEAASVGSLARIAFGGDLSGLRAVMEAARVPWLRDARSIESALGFGELQAMGALLRQEPPFADVVSKALRFDLGDWRDEIAMPLVSLRDAAERSQFYVGRGLNRALTDFTPRAFDESLVAAGLTDGIAAGSEAEDEEEADLARSRAAFDLLQRFEREMRRFVDGVMREAFGDLWIKQRIPADMKDKWIEKRNIAVSKGEAEGPLIDYADFTDYKAIIERNDNWQAVFRQVFGRQEDVRESFQRLFPVRICTMHARKVTSDDQLYLVAETTRLLRAIRKAS